MTAVVSVFHQASGRHSSWLNSAPLTQHAAH